MLFRIIIDENLALKVIAIIAIMISVFGKIMFILASIFIFKLVVFHPIMVCHSKCNWLKT